MRSVEFDFSAHAGHTDLVKFAESTRAQTVVLMHGDRRELLRDALTEIADVILPANGPTFSIA